KPTLSPQGASVYAPNTCQTVLFVETFATFDRDPILLELPNNGHSLETHLHYSSTRKPDSVLRIARNGAFTRFNDDAGISRLSTTLIDGGATILKTTTRHHKMCILVRGSVRAHTGIEPNSTQFEMTAHEMVRALLAPREHPDIKANNATVTNR